MLDFWASWCAPCIHESKRLEAARKRYGDRIAFIGVDTKDFSGDARAWQRKHGITYPSVHDGSGNVLDELGRTADPEDLLRRPQREGRRGADGGGRPAAVPAADRGVVRRLLLVVRRRVARGAGRACERAAPDAVGARGRGDVPVCGTTLDQSDSPAAQQIKRVIADEIAAGRHEERDQGAAGRGLRRGDPRRAAAQGLRLARVVRCRSRGSLAAALLVGLGAWRWSSAREPAPAATPLDPALERRLDDELARFEADGAGFRSAFLAGFASVAVAVRAAARARLSVGGLGGRGAAARRARRRPAGRARDACRSSSGSPSSSCCSARRRARSAASSIRIASRRSPASSSSCSGSRSWGCCRARAARSRRGFCTGARRRGSRVLLGGAFAVCAAPCVGTVLAGILRPRRATHARSCAARCCSSRTPPGSRSRSCWSASLRAAMAFFRWLRDHYRVFSARRAARSSSRSGCCCSSTGLWLRVALNRVLDAVGLGDL